MPPAHSLHTIVHNRLADTAAVGAEFAALTSIARVRKMDQPIAIAPAVAAPSKPLSPPRLVFRLEGHTYSVSCVAACADGERLVSSSHDGTARVWSATTGKILCTLAESSERVNCVALFSDGVRAVWGSTGYCFGIMRTWSLNSETELRAFREPTKFVHGVAVSPDDRTIASAGEETRLWNVTSGLLEATLTDRNERKMSVAFSPDGQTLASGGVYNTIKVWSVRTRQLLRIIACGALGHVINAVEFTPDGRYIVSGSSDGTIKVWNWRIGDLHVQLSGHREGVNSIAVFPDGERIASGGGDSTVRIWNLRSAELEHTLEGHTSCVSSVAVSRDARILVSGSSDKTVRVWAVGEADDDRDETP